MSILFMLHMSTNHIGEIKHVVYVCMSCQRTATRLLLQARIWEKNKSYS